MSDWNFKISEAPRGRPVSRTLVVGFKEDGTTKTREFSEFAPDWLWIATKCGKVLKSHWKPKDKLGGDRFIFLNKGEQPVAWQPYVVPVHPFVSQATSEEKAEVA